MAVKDGEVVFMVEHSYEVAGTGMDEIKHIGLYGTRLAAEAAVRRLSTQPGFRDRPEGFHIDKCVIGRDNWAEGYCTWDEVDAE